MPTAVAGSRGELFDGQEDLFGPSDEEDVEEDAEEQDVEEEGGDMRRVGFRNVLIEFMVVCVRTYVRML